MMTKQTKTENGRVFVWDDEWGPSRQIGTESDGTPVIEIDGGWREIEATGLQRFVAKIFTWLFG